MNLRTYALSLLLALPMMACGQKAADAPPSADAAAAKDPPKSPIEPVDEAPPKKLVMPDACGLVTVEEVAAAAGWKSAQAVPVKTGAEWLAACNYVDAANAAHVVNVALAFGALIPDDAAQYAKLVGTKDGYLKQPATPVTTYGVDAIEMDAGANGQSIQTRIVPTSELTVTSPLMPTSRVLFPKALKRLQAILTTS
ncbi:MAG TPA: hypothetical protein VMF52_11265 [Steroidobacteraceae bacterium]|nr:hypothetical protein [Steroidobacteraceae bacterium]